MFRILKIVVKAVASVFKGAKQVKAVIPYVELAKDIIDVVEKKWPHEQKDMLNDTLQELKKK